MAEFKIKFKKLPAQEKIFNDDQTKILMFSGGYASGKTFLLCMKIIKLSYQNKKFSGGIMCPSYPDLKRDVIPTFEKILNENRIKYVYHKTEKWFWFPWMADKARVYLFSAEKPLVGPNLAYIGVNEMSLIPKERFYECLFRVRVKSAQKKQVILVGTPEDRYSFLEEFVEQQEKTNETEKDNFKIIYGNTKDNIHIDEGYQRLLESNLDQQALKVFMEGQIIRLGGNYFYYSFSVTKNVTEEAKRIDGATVCVALDFNIGRMTASFWNIVGKECICFDELLLLGNSDTREMCKAIKARFKVEEVELYIDASAKNRRTNGISDLKILEDEGFKGRIFFKAVNPTFRDRQLAVNNKFDRGEIKIHPKCKTVIKDCKSVKQMKSDFSKDKSNPELTHASDGMDYLIDYKFTVNLNRSKTIQL